MNHTLGLNTIDIERRLLTDPAWGVRTADGRWVNPIACALTTLVWPEGEPASAVAGQVARELQRAGVTSLDARPAAPEHQVRALALLHDHPAWRVVSPAGRWVNPFSGRETGVVVNEPARPEAHWDEIWRAVSESPEYRQGQGVLRHPTHVTRRLETSRLRSIAAAVSRLLDQSPEWGRFTPEGQWHCPLCERFIPHIREARDAHAAAQATVNVSEHLANSCQPFRDFSKDVSTAELPARLLARFHAQPKSDRMPAAQAKDRNPTTLTTIRQKQLRILSAPPQVDGLDIGVTYMPCDEVGGDFFDFIAAGDGRGLGIVHGDVSGHGVEVWGDMTNALKSVRQQFKATTSPARVLAGTNDDLTADLISRTFVSGAAAYIDVERFTLSYARAGHMPLLLFNPQRSPEPFLNFDPPGMVMGMASGKRFSDAIEEIQVQLYEGDLLLFYSDGVTEAMNPQGEQYENERLRAVLARTQTEPTARIMREIVEDLARFTGTEKLEDDLSMVAVKVL